MIGPEAAPMPIEPEDRRSTLGDFGAKPYDWAGEPTRQVNPPDSTPTRSSESPDIEALGNTLAGDKVETQLAKPQETKKLAKRIRRAALATLAVLGFGIGAEVSQHLQDRSDIDPIELADHNEPADTIEIEGIAVGAEVRGLNADIQVDPTSVNLRSSPDVIESGDGSSNQRAGGTEPIYAVNPFVVETPDNGRWYGFADKDGQMSWVQADQPGVEIIEDDTLESTTPGVAINPQGTRSYTITQTTTRGIAAEDVATGEVALVGTVVELGQ